ncbi:Leucine--tRNA ligase [subsurface metagenome]
MVQVNGKLRDRITVSASITEAEARQLAMESPKVRAYLEGKEIINTIYVPRRLINLVVR